jgi:ubiquinol-cytochrome c reductase cytochrome b/c1 subunit
VVLHIWALHVSGQNNPTGVEPKSAKDTVPFTPYATVKDGFFLGLFLILYAWFVFFIPNYLGHPDNYIPANPGATPAEIVPEWYYLPFYAILRSIPNKLLGVTALFSSIGLLFFLPWLDTSPVRSARYRPLYRQFFWIFVIVCIGLGWLGSKQPQGIYVLISRVFTAWYFIHLLVILPLLGLLETPQPLPSSISEAVLKKAKVAVKVALVLLTFGGLLAVSRPALAQETEELEPPRNQWSFAGPFGRYDQAQLQRGFRVYHDVCQNCHSLSLVAFRTLGEPDGLGYSEDQVKTIAAGYKVKDGPNDQGEMFDRPGRPADYFPPPFANEQAARAVLGGAAPPDMSVLAKARGFQRGFPNFVYDIFTQYQEEGPDYIVALLNGYEKAPPGFVLPPGTQYNKYFPAKSIGMPNPLSDGQITYDDGSPQTAQQYALDVAAFLEWTAEPHLVARKRIGFQVMVFLVVFATLLYFTKKRVWQNAHSEA